MKLRDQSQRKKGSFGDARLPVTRMYIFPLTRRKMMVASGIAGLLILLFAAFDIVFQKGSFISSGPLSSNHAIFEEECVSCHEAGADLSRFSRVTDQKCSACHEKYGDKLGVYTFSAHYLYRSDDYDRLHPTGKEQQCFWCHEEHQGRSSILTAVGDKKCLNCHRDEKHPEFRSFDDGHPQFSFVRDQTSDDGNLKFTHIHHVAEIQKRKDLLDIEKACLYCHIPREDGKSFEPIRFERSCDACHLTTSVRTPMLPVREAGVVGVQTLATIRERQGTAALWAYSMSENEFRRLGRLIQKTPLYHEDPWIMENLRQLRRELYPDPGLADLIAASGDVPPQEIRSLYREAIARLRERVNGLRARPESEIQQDLLVVTKYLEQLERKLNDPYLSLDDTKFLLGTLAENPSLSDPAKKSILDLADMLTQPCQKCHVVHRATIQHVQKDQRVLRRAEFNHRDHILHRRCLDCHVAIPVAEFAGNPRGIAPAQDRAEIQNIPSIETCVQCHRQDMATNRCTTCHFFHPNKSRRSELLLYVE